MQFFINCLATRFLAEQYSIDNQPIELMGYLLPRDTPSTTMDFVANFQPNTLVANGTINREARPNVWIACRVKIKTEKKCAKRLESFGYETFVPVRCEDRQWSDRKKTIEVILIPMVIFVQLPQPDIIRLTKLGFIHSIIKYPGSKEPAIIPSTEINQFKFLIENSDQNLLIEPFSPIKGQMIEIVRGKLKGLTGQITQTSQKGCRITIAIQYLTRASVAVNISDCRKIVD